MRRVLVVKAGATAASVRVAFGDYDRWFARAFPPGAARCTVVEAHVGAALPQDARGHDAVIVTGSPRSVIERAPWMARTGEWLLEIAARGVPVLGVCFGHQLLASALGAKVRRSPLGREIGTVACTRTAAGRDDPLLDGVPDRFEVQATHEDAVFDAPPALEVLAGNAHSAVQAFRAGRNVRGVQFHPEIDAAVMRALVEARAASLSAEEAIRGGDPARRVGAVLAGIRPTPAGGRILRNFLERCV